MKRNKDAGRHAWRPIRRGFLPLALAILCFLTVALGAAAQTGAEPTPSAGATRPPSPYSQLVPTNAELLGMAPSIERYLAAHTLPASAFQAADLTGSTKTASDDLVNPGQTFQYTIEVENSGDFDIPAEVTDTLPAQMDYIDSDCVAFITDTCAFAAGTLTWAGTVTEGGSATITITVRLKDNAEPGAEITNTAKIESADQTFNRSATITVDEPKSSPTNYLPIAAWGLPPDPGPVTLTVGQPNGLNSWSLSWTESVGASGYEIQEAHTADFSDATPILVGQQTSLVLTKTPSPYNVYFYRMRSRVGEMAGPWSNVGQVVGGYRDDFDDPSTGWSMRRSTYLEDVKGFYENGKYVMQIFDRWDWGIASPLRPAPRVPYVIDFEMRSVSQIYAQSAGMVFGGDWNGETCPPGTSFDDWYRHDNCFNHFYNTNSIYNDSNPNRVVLQLLFERVDRLEWCPNCGGSPMKRVGDIGDLDNFNNVNAKDWNHFRIEVRPNSIKLFAAPVGQPLALEQEYTDTRWITSPYFGFFTSTDVIDNLTWRFEYVQVMPLD